MSSPSPSVASERQWTSKSSVYAIPLIAPSANNHCRRKPSNHVAGLQRNRTSIGTCSISTGCRDSIDSQRSSFSTSTNMKKKVIHARINSIRFGAVDISNLKNVLTQQEVAENKRFKAPGEARELFKKVVRRAIICLQWITSVFNIQDNFIEQELQQLYDKSKNAEQALCVKQMELAGRVFNKQDFRPNREIYLKREIEYILTVPADSRSEKEITLVLNTLQSVKSFTEYPIAVQRRLCQVAWYQKVLPRKVIIRQGHQGLNFYFVISGRGIIKVLRRRSDGTIMNGEKVVFKVEPGSSFGDIALLHNVERTATVESDTEMSLLVISRADFIKIFLQRELDGAQPEHLTFLRTVNALKHWPVDSLSESSGNCTYHYFKRGKLIVADSNNSDFLYIIKSGSCEVMKQLVSVTPHTSSEMMVEQKRIREITENAKPNNGFRPKATVPTVYKLPPVRDALAEIDAKAAVQKSMKAFIQAKREEPNLMLDVPTILHERLAEMQKEMASKKLSNKPVLAGIVCQLVKQQRRKKQLQEKYKDISVHSKIKEEDEARTIPKNSSRRPISSTSLSSSPGKDFRSRDGANPLSCSTESQPALINLVKEQPSNKSSVGENSNSEELVRVHSGDRRSVVSAEDEEHRSKSRANVVRKQSSLTHFRLIVSESPNSGQTRQGYSKSKMVQVSKRWKITAAGKSDETFQELEKAKDLLKAAETIKKIRLKQKTSSYSNYPKMQNASLMISHEGKSQTVTAQDKNEKGSTNKSVFVRLGLLRAKDMFGLETLNFDANCFVSDTSVCLVSRGAEVLMIGKKFFLENCNSENLEHLRNVVAPYPMENSMQDNLQVSVDWDIYCNQLINQVLEKMDSRKPLR